MEDHEFHPPKYPQVTKAQWAVLSAMTDQRCANFMEALDFVSDLSPEAKQWLRDANKEKIATLNENLLFYSTSKTIWKFLWIGGGVVLGIILGANQLWKAFGEHFLVKMR